MFRGGLLPDLAGRSPPLNEIFLYTKTNEPERFQSVRAR